MSQLNVFPEEMFHCHYFYTKHLQVK